MLQRRPVVGIDPGLQGGLARLYADEIDHPPSAMRMPKRPAREGGGIDWRKVSDQLEWWLSLSSAPCYIEQASTRPGQSAQSGLTTGTNFGVLIGILEALHLRYVIVRPQVWQHGVGVPPCRMPLLGADGQQLRTKRGTPRTTTDRTAKKAAVVDLVQQRWPSLDLAPGRCTTPQDGMADAVAIAWYGALAEGGGRA